jgi:hypothetical protein
MHVLDFQIGNASPLWKSPIQELFDVLKKT